VLDVHGRWSHEGEAVEHPGLVAAFFSWVAVHPDDGRWILTNGYDWCYFTPLATAYFVVGVDRANGPTIKLSDGTEEVLDPSTVRIDEDGTLRCLVKQGRAGARFSRLAQLAMEPLLVDGDPVTLAVAGRSYPIVASGAA